MRKFGWTVIETLDFVRSKRSIVCPNQGFMRHLFNYQLSFKNKDHNFKIAKD